jgi:hypothetical protein
VLAAIFFANMLIERQYQSIEIAEELSLFLGKPGTNALLTNVMILTIVTKPENHPTYYTLYAVRQIVHTPAVSNRSDAAMAIS